jgi:hypothetical protein
VPPVSARPNICRCFSVRAGQACGLTLALFLLGSHASQAAAGAGATHAISRHHIDTGSDIDALRAALEREATRWREAAHLTAAEPPHNHRLYDDAGSIPDGGGEAKRRAPGMTPDQIIRARDYWHGAAAANSDQGSRGTPGAVVAGGADQARARPGATLFYAEQPGRQDAAPVAETAPPAAVDSAQGAAPMPQAPAATTIVFKRTGDQTYSTIVAAPPRINGDAGTALAAPPAPRPHPADDPWLNAVLLSPNIDRYLTTLVLGDPDYRALTPLVEKPANGVLMTFSANPNSGLTTDRFSGSAVVFLPTVTYPADTSSLR